MLSNRLAFAVLAAACITAAAAGGYLASRQNAVPTPASAAAAPAPASAPTVTSAPAPVQETEAVVGDRTSKAGAGAPIAEANPTSVATRRNEPASRTPNRLPVEKPANATVARQRAPLPQDRTAAANAAAQQPPAPPVAPTSPVEPPTPTLARPDERVQEPARAPEPPAKTFEELVVPSDSVMGLALDRTISSDTARLEDRVDARVIRDVRANDHVAIPSGTRAIGTVTQVEKGGKFKERARLAIRFHTLVLADGTRVPVNTETIYREGEAPSAAQKIGGGAVGGAILGAILGGAKGAAVGAAAGAAGGTAVTAAGDKSAVTMPAGTQTTVRILSPVTITIEK